MFSLPKKNSLVNATAHSIQERIRGGVWKGFLPGERALAETLQVGRDTLRQALKSLENDGWLETTSQGARRRIRTAKKNRRAALHGRIALLSPKRLEEMSPSMLLEIDHLRRILGLHELQLEIVSPDLFHLISPGNQLEQLVKRTRADVWLLHQTSLPIQEWFQQHQLPCLIRGYPQPGISLPFFDTNWEATAFHAGGMLLRAGHRRIGLILPDQKLEGHFASSAGLQRAIKQNPTPASLQTIREDRTKEHLAHGLEQAFASADFPQALVATRARHVLTVLSWLAMKGKKVPQDVSLIALDHNPMFEFLFPSIASYRIPAEQNARTLAHRLQTLQNGGKISAAPWIFPEFLPGNSLGNRK